MTLLLILAVFCLAGAAFLIGEIVTAPSRQRYVSVRRAATWGKMELPSGTPQEGLHERLIAPIGEVLARWALKLNPRSTTDNVARRLMAAGLGMKLSPTGFLALKALLALVGVFAGSLLGSSRGFVGLVLGAAMAGTIGFLGPDYVLTLKARGRKEKIRADLPDAPELSAFTRAIIQADQLGTTLGRILRVQATDARLRRQAAAEERAMKAPIKMLFPTVLFIFPAMFLVILGPAILNVEKLFG